ncbi:MAG: NADH:flavin oxidoreductase [Planctomycetota bacterium]
MRFKPPGRHRTVEEFRAYLRALDPSLDCDPSCEGDGGPLGWPLEFRGRTLTNRFCIHPMEGWDAEPNGLPSDLTLRRWRGFGRSGAKLIWGGEAFAVQADGRANPRQLYLNPEVDVGAGLARLFHAVREGHREIGEDPDELYIGLQLTHSGRFARPEGPPAPRLAAHHPVLDARAGAGPDTPLLTDGELEDIAERYVDAAELAWRVGFDFVDVKCCHGYLLHELLGARSRPGRYGGDFEGRTSLFRQIVSAIHSSCPELEIGVRASLADVFPFSADDDGVGAPVGWREHVPYDNGFGVDADDPRRFDLTEPLRVLELLRDLDIGIVNATAGSPYYCPHLQRPATYPPSDGYQPPQDPLLEVARHLHLVRRCKQHLPELLFVGTGYSYLQEWLPHVAQYELRRGHVDLIGLGRMTLSYPELPRDVLAGEPMARKLICRTFSDCTTGPRNGLVSGCYPLDERYKKMPEAKSLREIKERLKEERA